MKNFLAILAMAAGSVLALPAQAVTLNLGGVSNASVDGSNAQTFNLSAGTYRFSFVKDQFTAFSRFSSESGCVAGMNCVQGFENSARIVINGVTNLFGDGSANGGFGPVSGDAYFDTAETSFANAARYATTFTFLGPVNGSAYIFDDILSDNRGGISLNISAVPEPGTWGMLLLGFGGVGFAMRRRSLAVVSA